MHAFGAVLNNICVICFLICLLLFNVLQTTKLCIKKKECLSFINGKVTHRFVF